MGHHDKKENIKPDEKDKAAEKETPTAGEVTVSRVEYDTLKARAEERDSYYDKFLRAQAELENARRRLEKEKSDFLRYANEGFISEFLPILDNLEIAEKHIEHAKDFKAVHDGVDMIQKQIQKFVKDTGLERIKTVGEKFDPHLHEAVETVEMDDKDDGLIVEELKPGYRFHDKLLRPAMVKIVKKAE